MSETFSCSYWPFVYLLGGGMGRYLFRSPDHNLNWLSFLLSYEFLNFIYLFLPLPNFAPLWPLSACSLYLWVWFVLFIHCFVVLDFTYKWNHTVFVFLCLTYFTEHSTLEGHACVHKWWDCISFVLLNNINILDICTMKFSSTIKRSYEFSIHILDISPSSNIWFMDTFSSWWAVFLCCYGIFRKKQVFNLMKSNLSFFPFIHCAFGDTSKNFLPNIRCWRFLPMFFSRLCIALAFVCLCPVLNRYLWKIWDKDFSSSFRASMQ